MRWKAALFVLFSWLLISTGAVNLAWGGGKVDWQHHLPTQAPSAQQTVVLA